MHKLLNAVLIRERTALLAEQFQIEPEPVEGKRTAAQIKADKIGRAIADGDFGCRRESVRVLVQAITGLPITVPKSDDDNRPSKRHVVGSLIVFEEETLLVNRIDSDDDAFFVTENLENETQRSSKDYIADDDDFRPATEAEIVSFLRAVGVPTE